MNTIKRPLTPAKPSPRAALARRVEAREEQNRVARALADKAAREAAEKRDAQHAEDVRAVASARARAVGMGEIQIQRFANRIESARRAHVASGNAKPFNAYEKISDALADLGHGLKRPRGNALDASLPPPSVSEGHKPPPGVVAPSGKNEAQAREAQAAAARDRAAVHAAEVRSDRERYEERLRALGLRNPATMPDPAGSAGIR
jgi:hypothetical protein